MEIPAVSIIIPMFNVEKYIGELLDSILAQTFQDFEVIVVDDCSTDNSVAIVKDYAPKFNGRLTLISTQKNSGSPAKPSNLGIAFSRGEYLFFLDDDDAITPTALEEFYPVAKKFDADVVTCEKFYNVPDKFWNDAEFRRQLKPCSYQRGGFVTEPTFLTNDLSERVKNFLDQKFLWPLWTKILKRDFLTINKVRFAPCIVSDLIFTTCLIFSAEKWLRVPNVINYWRAREDSFSNSKKDFRKHLHTYSQALVTGFNHLDNFLSYLNFFQQNPDMKYLVLKVYVEHIVSLYFSKLYLQIPSDELYDKLVIFDEIFRKEFAGDNAALTAHIFNFWNVYREELIRAQRRIKDLENLMRENKAYIAELENFIINQLNKE